jgi:protein-L-isoaspartate(D-aspartate) O-methyltransferase
LFGHRSHALNPSPDAVDPYARAREDMIEQQLRARGVVMHSVLEAMRAIPRHLFVSHPYAERAYADEALPSVENQTISQPYIVAIMTQELALKPGHRVLEIGTGTGYQTAILAYLVSGGHPETTPASSADPRGEVYTVERVPALAEFARNRLAALHIHNVHFHVGDGSEGWPAALTDAAEEQIANVPPHFDRIIVTAATPEVPRPLTDQLADGGIMVAPVGPSDSQTLTRIVRQGESLVHTPLMDCRFVPLLGSHAWDPAHPPVLPH